MIAIAIDNAKQANLENIELFRSKFGQLSSSVVVALEGWTASNNDSWKKSWKTYTDPHGRKFKSLTDIEAHFGQN